MLNQVYQMMSQGEEISYHDYIASLHGKNIALYGAGGVGAITSSILKDNGCRICCFIDDAPAKQGASINGLKVVSLENIHRDADYVILLCMPNFIEKIGRASCRERV